MILDFTKINKEDFECIQMGDNKENVYFGQLQYMHCETAELKESIEDIEEEEERAKYTRVRHGAGIQLFGKNGKGVTCKYAGEWCKD